MAEEKKGFFRRLIFGLKKTRKNISYIFNGFTNIDDDFYEELYDVLIMSDMGVRTTEETIEELKEYVRENKIKQPDECRQVLIDSLTQKMNTCEADYEFEKGPAVLLIIGVNGVGKTTTVGKLASYYRNAGKKVVIAAADTFRAAATEQLKEWAKRSGADIIAAGEGADPAAVVYDAIEASKARKADMLIVDTAGRLQNKKNLMNELAKINRVIGREWEDAYKESLIVLDATTGQNALVQAREFRDAADIDGTILTKLDGTAKGGIAVAIQAELNVPVKFIGVGESVSDLQKFDPAEFVEALFAKEEDTEQE
ncbi:MAG: signal recognition particle-docking protein FtsY [Lachnospiraceae bacterium]|nr:signal recognition particle-docking protein FtsY [Lachnospiraceae bacterium]